MTIVLQVSVDLVMKTFAENAAKALAVFECAIQKVAAEDWTAHIADMKVGHSSTILIISLTVKSVL
jgi:hypothetical protein